MDHLFEFTNDLTKEFFRLVTQEGVTSYKEDDGKLATLAVKNVLAGRGFTVIGTEHYKELLDGQWIGEPVMLHDILDRYEALRKADSGGSCETLALDAILHTLAESGLEVVSTESYERVLSKLDELTNREQISANITVLPKKPPVVIVTKEGAVHANVDISLTDYRKGADCMACEGYFFFRDLRITYRLDERGHSDAHSRKHVCLNCAVTASGIPL